MLEYLRIVLAAHVKSERGASAVEYGLLIAGVAAMCIVGAQAFGLTLGAIFSAENSRLETP
jgi:pilus assembly protein Flp/PilA